MKKLMSMMLCVVLAMSLTVSANAAGSSPLSIEAAAVSATSTELTIRVRLTAPVTDGVFSFHYDAAQLKLLSAVSPVPDAAEINGPASAQGLSAGANLPAGQIKTAFVFDETGAAGDIVLECSFQITGYRPGLRVLGGRRRALPGRRVRRLPGCLSVGEPAGCPGGAHSAQPAYQSRQAHRPEEGLRRCEAGRLVL